MPIYRGYSAANFGKNATLLIGTSHREVQLEDLSNSQQLFLSTNLTPTEVEQINRNDLLISRGLGLLFMEGFQRATATADLPAANSALDTAMKACHVATISHVVPPAASNIPSYQVAQLKLAKVALGMSVDDVRSALGGSYRYDTRADLRIPRLSYFFAVGIDNGYTFLLIDGKVQGFSYESSFQRGKQPLVTNLTSGIIEKTWQPLNDPNAVYPHGVWGSDLAGKPITRFNASSHAQCKGVQTSSSTDLHLPYIKNATGGDMSLQLVVLQDGGPDCGVTLGLDIGRSDQDHSLAEEMNLEVANQDAIRHLIMATKTEQQQQIDEVHRKANQVKNPF